MEIADRKISGADVNPHLFPFYHANVQLLADDLRVYLSGIAAGVARSTMPYLLRPSAAVRFTTGEAGYTIATLQVEALGELDLDVVVGLYPELAALGRIPAELLLIDTGAGSVIEPTVVATLDRGALERQVSSTDELCRDLFVRVQSDYARFATALCAKAEHYLNNLSQRGDEAP